MADKKTDEKVEEKAVEKSKYTAVLRGPQAGGNFVLYHLSATSTAPASSGQLRTIRLFFICF